MGELTVLLPCLNEEQALPSLLMRLRGVQEHLPASWRLSVLVVDDGSTDRTAQVAREQHPPPVVTLVQHESNRGLGEALKTGVAWFLAQPLADTERVLAVMDADGTHPPELLSAMLSSMSEAGVPPCDVVIASRYAPGGEEHGLPRLRLIYSRMASSVLRVLARLPGVRDYTCGYRLYRRDALARARERFGDALITERSFVCMAELLIKLGRCSARIVEVPLKLHYELKGGPSKMNVPRTILRYIALSWRLLFDPRLR